MKTKLHYILLILLIFSLNNYTNAQLTVSKIRETRTCLIENFNGILNGYSPDASKLADNMMAADARINYIEIHAGPFAQPSTTAGHLDLRTTQGDAVHGNSGLFGYPLGNVSRKIFPTETVTAVSRGKWALYSQLIMADTSPVNLNVLATNNPITGKIDIEVAIYYTQTVADSHMINIAITQNNIVTFQQGANTYPARMAPGGNYIQMNILRDYVTPQNGQFISNRTKGSQTNLTFSYTPTTINGIAPDVNNMNVVAYITKDNYFSEVLTCKTFKSVGNPLNFISGNLTLNSFPNNSLKRVYLIEEATVSGSPYLTAIDSVDTKTSYTFNNIPVGVYYVKAAIIPPDSVYSLFLPTYYGKELLWSNAIPINHNGQTLNKDIDLIAGVNPGGPGFIGGSVILGANLIPGDPISGLSVLLTTQSGDPVTHTVTDQNGEYGFSNLAYGTYLIYIDQLNIPANPTTVVLSPSDHNKSNLDLELNSTGTKPVGLQQINEKVMVNAYPNPSNGLFNLEINTNSDKVFLIEIVNMRGQIVLTKELNCYSGNNVFELNLENNKSGLYILKLDNGYVKSIQVVN